MNPKGKMSAFPGGWFFLKCAIYCRVSTEEQVNGGHSIEAQRKELIDYCSEMDFEVFDFYVDAGFSASTMNRPALQRMLGELGGIDVVLVWRLDRISRDMADLMKILEIFQNSNVAFKSKTESFDTLTASGRLMLNMLGSFAEFERASISERIKLAHRKILHEGKWRGGPPPFGYRAGNAGTLEINGDEAPIIRRIFELSAGMNIGTPAIAGELNKSGCITRNGKPFTASYVVRLLTNPVYCGQMIYGRQKYNKKNGKKQVVYSRNFETYNGAFEPIISEELFYRSLACIKGRRADRGVSGAVGGILGGLVYCGNCKARMVRNKRKNGESFYLCSSYKNYRSCTHHYISESRIKSALEKACAGVNLGSGGIEYITSRLQKEDEKHAEGLRSRKDKLGKQINEYGARENILFDLVEKQQITREEFIRRKSRLAELKLHSEAALADIERGLVDTGITRPDIQLEKFGVLSSEFDKFRPEFRKKLLQCIIQRIEIMDSARPYGRRRIDFYFKI
jgi:site-specific DNA recombinase